MWLIPIIKPLPGQQTTQGPIDWVVIVVGLALVAVIVGVLVAVETRSPRAAGRSEPAATKTHPPARAA
jgi:hypothetical protein